MNFEWSRASNWNPGVPVSSATTVLEFGGNGFRYFSVNDLAGTFTLNRINLVDRATVEISGNPLRFDGSAPTIANSSTNSADPSIGNNIEFAATTTYQANVTASSGGQLTLTGTLSGAGGLTVTGPVPAQQFAPGRLVLNNTGANTYAGGTTITGGSLLEVRNDAQLGTGGVTLNGGALQFLSVDTSNRTLTLVGAAAGNTIRNPAGNTTLNGLVTGSGGLTVNSTLTLGNAANNYTGDTVVEGTLRIASGTALGSTAAGTTVFGGTLEVSGNITVAEPLSLVNNGSTPSLASTGGANTWSGPISLSRGPSGQFFTEPTIRVAAGSVLTISGQVANGTGSVASLRVDSGTNDAGGSLVLTNANTYTGETSIFNTTLLANNTTGSATGPNGVTIQSGGVLGGTGTVAGLVFARVANANATINPGDSTLGANQRGNLKLNGGLSLAGVGGSEGGTYRWDLGALSEANPGIDFDRITVGGGDLALGGSSRLTLDFGALGANGPDSSNPFWQSPRQWTIIDVAGSGTNDGNRTFSQITNPTYAAGTFVLLDPAANGGDVVLAFTPVPEPATVVGAGAVGLAAAGWARRRRAGCR